MRRRTRWWAPSLWPLLLLSGGGCRRHHVVPTLDAPPVELPVAEEDQPVAPPAAPLTTLTPKVVARKSTVDAGTLNGDSNGPTAAALDQKLAAMRPHLTRCLDLAGDTAVGQTVTINVGYTILPSGKTDRITLVSKSPLAPTAESCMRGELSALTFDPFGGGALVASFPLTYTRATK